MKSSLTTTRFEQDIYCFDARQPGKHLLILGGIHGNEICGPLALQSLINEISSSALEICRGKLTIVPVCNPRAYQEGKRFIEKDLNRFFRRLNSRPDTYEENLALELIPLVETCDYVLDIHSLTIASEPFVIQDYLDKNSLAFGAALGFSTMITGWPEAQKLHQDNPIYDVCACAKTYRKASTVVECGQDLDQQAQIHARGSAIAAIRFLDLIPGNPVSPNKITQVFHIDKVIFHSPGSCFPKDWCNLELVRRGEIIATFADGRTITSEKDCHIIMPNPAPISGKEWFYLASATDYIP